MSGSLLVALVCTAFPINFRDLNSSARMLARLLSARALVIAEELLDIA